MANVSLCLFAAETCACCQRACDSEEELRHKQAQALPIQAQVLPV